MFNNPQGALDLAKGLVNADGGPLIDIQATAEAFLSQQPCTGDDGLSCSRH